MHERLENEHDRQKLPQNSDPMVEPFPEPQTMP